jgi:peptide/nickel transport system permease protein
MSEENKQEATSQVVNMANLRGGIAYASAWQLMWARFCKHRVALVSMFVVIAFYFIALFCEVLATMAPDQANSDKVNHPPQITDIHLFDGSKFAPYIPAYTQKRDPESLAMVYTLDPSYKIYLGLFVHGYKYNLLGLLPTTDWHLFGAKNPEDRIFLLGSDNNGQDVYSRILYGARYSLSLGLIGVFLSLTLGIIIGGISGYYGGWVDWCVMRVVEFILSLPTIPIWLAMAAVLPPTMPAHLRYMAITVIISLIGWTHLARVVRGRLLAMRGEVFVIAAKLDGCSEGRVIFRHMMPSLVSHIIAQVTLAIPSMILAETSLSFLGVGLQPPAISWGVLLNTAQKIVVLAKAPWMLLPGVAVVIAVLALNFFGDGLRDAADPYSH